MTRSRLVGNFSFKDHDMNRFVIAISFLILLVCVGCGGFSNHDVDIPKDLNGDWNLKGTLTAKDDSITFNIDQNLTIDDGRVLLADDGEWEAAKVGDNLNIGFSIVVSEEDVAGCGMVRTMADSTIIIPVIEYDDTQYDGIAVGIFRINSDCDGKSSKELDGDFILKRR
jgi:hypothetical protein